MAGPENTTRRDPLLHLAGALAEGSSGYIENMEAAGQRQVVGGNRLPSEGRLDPAIAALGIECGDPDPDDPLFCSATLPAGWRRVGSDHAMWSYLHDERNIPRVGVFYKAAFYDRKAFMHVANVGREYATGFIYNDAPVPWDRLTEAERSEFVAELERYATDAERHPEIYGGRLPKVQARLDVLKGPR